MSSREESKGFVGKDKMVPSWNFYVLTSMNTVGVQCFSGVVTALFHCCHLFLMIVETEMLPKGHVQNPMP